MPAVVAQRLPDITKEIAQLSLKMKEERVKVLKDNEEHIAEQKKKQAADGESGDEELEDVDDDEEEESQKEILDKIAKIRKGEDLDDEDDDDEDDDDYEYTGGDLAIYDSALDEIDELLFIKDTLERINQVDAGYTAQLLSAMPADLQAQFNENMQTAQALKEREEVVRKECDELEFK